MKRFYMVGIVLAGLGLVLVRGRDGRVDPAVVSRTDEHLRTVPVVAAAIDSLRVERDTARQRAAGFVETARVKRGRVPPVLARDTVRELLEGIILDQDSAIVWANVSARASDSALALTTVRLVEAETLLRVWQQSPDGGCRVLGRLRCPGRRAMLLAGVLLGVLVAR